MDRRPLPSIAALKAFCAIAEVGGFGRAAERLGSTQTAVSHQIAQLEGWIGGALFERGRLGARLTPKGARLYPSVAEALLRLEEALRTARADAGRNRVELSVTPEFSSQWLAPRLADFVRRFPDVELALSVGYQTPDFTAGRADLAIRLGGGTVGLVAEPLTADDEFAVCAPSLAGRLPKRQAFLAAPCLTYDGVRHTALDWQRWFEQVDAESAAAGFADQLAAAISFPTFADMLAACRRGEGFALVRNSLVDADLGAGTLVRAFIESQPAPFNYSLIYPRASIESPAARSLRDWIVGAARGEAHAGA
ncbi:LysR substrate-binding domain-containing protein [Pleomorphomonas koreensis]|uniref:LysR substrate-binding domain-containing protein n=1 Tax=Pleomorphomonas koreensis TaxID=257440 RepID=UPI00041DC1B6|nr:LysR substrate-binding domain-containing protein [Pleomorphomonas koreensis]